jgi:hypothetical protein
MNQTTRSYTNVEATEANRDTEEAAIEKANRELVNPEWLADFRFDTHFGLKSDIA